MTETGDTFVIEIEDKFQSETGGTLYRMKGFNSLVFDEKGIEKLKKLQTLYVDKEVMKVNITDKRNPPMVRYSELPVGAVFDACGDIAIKCADGDAVCLRDGNYICRQPSDLVTPLNAEVVIS